MPLLIAEYEDNTATPVEQSGQAFASGANIALRQDALGLDSSSIAMTNWQLYLFAAVSLLDRIPVLHILSTVLDANDATQLSQIACTLGKVKAFIVKQARKIQAQGLLERKRQRSSWTLEIDTKKYFFKSKVKVLIASSLSIVRGAPCHIFGMCTRRYRMWTGQ